MKPKNNQPKLRFSEFKEEWELILLGDICSTFKSGSGITSKDINENGLYPVYGGNGLRGYSDRFTHNGNFILIGRQGALCGNIVRSSGKSFISEHAIAIQTNDKANNEWLAQKLEFMNLNQYSESSAQPGLAVNKLIKLKIIAPSNLEQKKIGVFFKSVDDRIQKLNRKMQLLEQYKKGCLQQIFSQKIRFKDNNSKSYPAWLEKELGEIAFKKSSNISANSLNENNGKYVIYGASGQLKKIDFYREKDSYISIVKDGAGAGRVLMCKEKTSVLGTLDIIKNKENIDLVYLYSVLETLDFKKYITGSTIPHIYFKDYSKEQVKLPIYQEQQKIANFLSAIDTKINLVADQLRKTQEFKKGLLQQMFI